MGQETIQVVGFDSIVHLFSCSLTRVAIENIIKNSFLARASGRPLFRQNPLGRLSQCERFNSASFGTSNTHRNWPSGIKNRSCFVGKTAFSEVWDLYSLPSSFLWGVSSSWRKFCDLNTKIWGNQVIWFSKNLNYLKYNGDFSFFCVSLQRNKSKTSTSGRTALTESENSRELSTMVRQCFLSLYSRTMGKKTFNFVFSSSAMGFP